jgi:hypothetical protein
MHLLVSHEAQITPGITFFADFYCTELKPEPDPELIDGKQMFYFTVGLNNPNTTATRFSMGFEDTSVRSALSGTPQSLNIMPPENETPTVIFLMRCNRKTDDAKIKHL